MGRMGTPPETWAIGMLVDGRGGSGTMRRSRALSRSCKDSARA
jgi:hypothetical protein